MWPECLTLAIILVATVFDLRTREVPDLFAALLIAWACAIVIFQIDALGWQAHVGGLCVGFLAGAPFFAGGGLGGADVKLLAALGAAVGHPVIWQVLFWMAIAGSLLALVALGRGRRTIAYLPAIALGVVGHILWMGQGGHAAI